MKQHVKINARIPSTKARLSINRWSYALNHVAIKLINEKDR